MQDQSCPRQLGHADKQEVLKRDGEAGAGAAARPDDAADPWPCLKPLVVSGERQAAAFPELPPPPRSSPEKPPAPPTGAAPPPLSMGPPRGRLLAAAIRQLPPLLAAPHIPGWGSTAPRREADLRACGSPCPPASPCLHPGCGAPGGCCATRAGTPSKPLWQTPAAFRPGGMSGGRSSRPGICPAAGPALLRCCGFRLGLGRRPGTTVCAGDRPGAPIPAVIVTPPGGCQWKTLPPQIPGTCLRCWLSELGPEWFQTMLRLVPTGRQPA